MKVKFVILLFLIFTSFSNSHAEQNTKQNTQENICAYGSHKELYEKFAQKNYIVIAQGKRMQPDGHIKDFADVLFLLSPEMDFFHAVAMNGIHHDHFKACIFYSGREIDYQFAPPIADILLRVNRQHQIFLSDSMPANATCPKDDKDCVTWSDWAQKTTQTFLFSAYKYSSNWPHDPYDDIVELMLDSKVIHPTRGALAELARTKYALRLRNELHENIDEIKVAKDAYKQIYEEADHRLPLIFLSLTQNRNWSINEIDRENGLVHPVLHGAELELYPMSNAQYKSFK